MPWSTNTTAHWLNLHDTKRIWSHLAHSAHSYSASLLLVKQINLQSGMHDIRGSNEQVKIPAMSLTNCVCEDAKPEEVLMWIFHTIVWLPYILQLLLTTCGASLDITIAFSASVSYISAYTPFQSLVYHLRGLKHDFGVFIDTHATWALKTQEGSNRVTVYPSAISIGFIGKNTKFSMRGAPVDTKKIISCGKNQFVFTHRFRKPPKVCAKDFYRPDFMVEARKCASTTSSDIGSRDRAWTVGRQET